MDNASSYHHWSDIMAALKIDSKKYDFMKLNSKYDDFSAPALKIMVEGKNIVTKEFMAITSLIVETSIEEADIFSFTISNAYNAEQMSFKWVEDYFTPGNKVEISMGYIDKLLLVMEGIITSVRMTIGSEGVPTIEISGMDSSFLMMKGKKSFIWTKKKHSDIVTEIGKKYGLKVSTTATTAQFPTVIQNGQTDYDFIKRLSSMNGFEFFVTGSQLYFRDPTKENSPIMELVIGDNLISLEINLDIGEQLSGVVVKGYNIKKEMVEATADKITKMGSGTLDGPSLVSKLNKKDTIREIYEPVIDKNEADAMAKAILNDASRKFITGYAESVGLPELRAGRYITLKGYWGTTAKTVYVISCRHEIDQDGFTSVLNIGGNII